MKTWLEQFVKPRVKMSDVGRWIVGMGREYYEVLQPRNARIDDLVALTGKTRAEIVAECLDRGLPAVERENKGKK